MRLDKEDQKACVVYRELLMATGDILRRIIHLECNLYRDGI